MKKIPMIFMLLITLLSIHCLIGSGYEETNEYPIESIRYYIDVDESGVFTTKEEKFEWFECIYIDSNEEYHKHDIRASWANISNKSKIVEKKGNLDPDLYLTLEDYERLLAGESIKE